MDLKPALTLIILLLFLKKLVFISFNIGLVYNFTISGTAIGGTGGIGALSHLILPPSSISQSSIIESSSDSPFAFKR